MDLRTGEERWRTPERFGEYWSMVVQKDKILALDENGELLLFKANPEQFELLARKSVGQGSTWAHLAVASGRIYIRELEAMTAYQWQSPSQESHLKLN